MLIWNEKFWPVGVKSDSSTTLTCGKGFDFDVSKAEQIFDLLLKEKQLKLPENHKLPTA